MKLSFFLDRSISGVLYEKGLSKGEADKKAILFSKVVQSLIEVGIDSERESFGHFVPGRIEILGKHTDYGGGRSIVMTVERGFCIVAVPRDDNLVTLLSAEDGEQIKVVLSPDIILPESGWTNYPMTVLRRMCRNFGELRGADIAFISDLPQAAGLSSSSAFMISIFLSIAARNNLYDNPIYTACVKNDLELAAYLGTVENGQNFGVLLGDRGVGTFGGSEDHTAIICSEPNKLSQFAYCPARLERQIAVSSEFIFLVGFSGVTAEKTGAAQAEYNRAAFQVGELIDIWRTSTGGKEIYLADILKSASDAHNNLIRAISKSDHSRYPRAELLKRLEHFAIEDGEIIDAASDAFITGDLSNFGLIVDRSQKLGADILGNQIPETISLAGVARKSGAYAASSFGAGFGGAVWALVDKENAERFIDTWQVAYSKLHPESARLAQYFFSCPGPAAFNLIA